MNFLNAIMPFAIPARVIECGGKAGAATPLSGGPKLNKGESCLARESGVALRFPPHSMTRRNYHQRSLQLVFA